VSGPDRRYPLSWPGGWKRATSRRRSPLRARGNPLSVYTATDRLIDEMRRLGATSYVLSTNVELRNDGYPRSGQKEPTDPGAAVYFRLKNRDQVLACDAFTTVADNIGAIARHIEALRTMDRYGVGTVEQAFAGYVALPSRVEDAVDWRAVLRITGDAPLAIAEAQYRVLMRTAHPDVGGSTEAAARLNAAIKKAREVLK
jgi:hypothetical protein